MGCAMPWILRRRIRDERLDIGRAVARHPGPVGRAAEQVGDDTAGPRGQPGGPAGRTGRAGGRERVGQVADPAGRDGPAGRVAGGGDRRFGPAGRDRAGGRARPGAARVPRPPDRDDLPGPDDLARPGAAGRRADRRGPARAWREPPRRAGADAGGAGRGAVARPGAALPRLPARAVRGHAAARDDRRRAGRQPAAAAGRRTDHRARRHHPAADPGAGRAAAAGPAPGRPVGHPRSWGGRAVRATARGHVRGPNRRGRADRGRVCLTPASLYGRSATGRAVDLGRADRAGADTGLAAGPGPATARLFVRAAVSAGAPGVFAYRSGALGAGPGGGGCVPRAGLGVAAVTGPVIEASGLVKVYAGGGRAKTALAGVSLTLPEGKCLGVVGESGCGKSTLARLLVGLERPTAGTVTLQGRPLASYPRPELARQLQLVSQDPFSSLNPRLTAGRALTEVLLVHRRVPGRRQAGARVTELLDMVSLGSRFTDRLPHEMSGGQAQRVAIARALAAEPQILILDEPTSALDVSVRAGIVNLLAGLRAELSLSYLFISHDMAVIRQLSDRIGVMYQGRFVERGPWRAVLSAPLHPYTRALLAAVPEPTPDGSLLAGAAADEASAPDVLAPANAGDSCPYLPRCPISIGRCRTEDPPLAPVAGEHEAACFRAGEVPVPIAADPAGIRPAAAADAEAMAELFVAAWRQAYPGVVPDAVLAALDHDRTARWLAGLIDGGPDGNTAGQTDVAVRDGQVIGFVRYGTRTGEPGGYVFGLYVHPAQAGHGTGRALLSHAEQRLREQGSDTVSLHVFEANERARRLYAKAGYAPDGSTRVEPEYEATEVRLVKVFA